MDFMFQAYSQCSTASLLHWKGRSHCAVVVQGFLLVYELLSIYLSTFNVFQVAKIAYVH